MIACITIPFFATAVERRDDTDGVDNGSEPGLVLGGQPWEPRPVYAYSREVARLGVKPGMSLRLAHILSPEARFMAASPTKYLGASGEITDILTDFTTLLEPEELWLYPGVSRQADGKSVSGWSRAFGRSLPARYTLDLENLPPAEALSLAKEMGGVVRGRSRLAPAVGLAESEFAARVAATLTQPNHARTIPSGEESTFLASQSVHFLPLDKEPARRLSMLGIRTMGQLAALPQSSLHAQFGQEFVSVYRLAQGWVNGAVGVVPHLIRPLEQEKRERVSHHFEEPVTNLLILERVLNRLAAELAGRLQASKYEAQTIQLSVEIDGGSLQPTLKRRSKLSQVAPGDPPVEEVGSITSIISRRHPTSALQRLTDSLSELLHRIWGHRGQGKEPIGIRGGVLSLTVELRDLTPAVSLQQLLFSRIAQTNGSPDSSKNQTKDPLSIIPSRHGKDCFYRPVLTNRSHPLPERRYQLRDLVPV